MNNLIAAIAVTAKIILRNSFSLSFLIIKTPSTAPIAMAGTMLNVRKIVLMGILCQNKICSGNLNKFIMKKNQAVVPIKSFFLNPVASRYTLNIGPAAFPIKVCIIWNNIVLYN